MLEQLIAALEQKSSDLTAEEMADVLWLTVQMWKSPTNEVTQGGPVTSKALPRPAKADPAVESSLPKSEPAKVTPPERSKSQTQSAAGVTTQQSTEADSSALGSPLAIPDSTALRRSLALLKAIRPLIRSVPSTDRTYLDVPATVKTIAQTDLWLLKLRPVPEPWLELALVIDVSPSMVIWQRTVLKLRQVLAQSGVFRDVRLWSLESTGSADKVASAPSRQGDQQPFHQLCLRSGFGAATARQVACRAEELLDPSGRRLILVVSDCIAPRWDEQPVRDMLQVWAAKGPMGLVQVLPEWLWSRTALDEVPKGQFLAQSAGQASQSLRFVSRRDRWRRQATVGIQVPVLTLEPSVANRWGRMVAGQSAVSSPGLVFSAVAVQSLLPNMESTADAEQSQSEQHDPKTEPTAQERIDQFRDFSSPMARRLAGLLAACPEVNLPVVRMVQEALLPASQQMHVAEVLLGGLFKPQNDMSSRAVADQVQYVFHDGVRSLVQHTVPPDEAFEALTRWLSRRFGYSLSDFQGYLTTNEGSEAVKPFAGVLLDVLKRRRRDYAELIQQVERVYRPGGAFPELELFEFIDAQLVESGATFPPPLQTEEFTVVTFEASNEPELFEFTVAMLQRRSRLFRADRWETQRQRQQAYRLTELLPDNVSLEVVAIPAGTFVMGSPSDESGHMTRESPQHEVTVEPFFMGRYPVTQAQWQVVAGLPQVERELEPDPARFKGDSRPVENVSWHDAVEFCARLSAHTGREYRLPSEAQWEYACRAGTTTPFHFGDMITTDVANYDGSAYAEGPKGKAQNKTTPVDQFDCANAFGLSEMHGNVWEWCADHWHSNYEGAPVDGSAWLTDDDDTGRVNRGGAWFNGPRYCRSAIRSSYSPGYRDFDVGFRVSCSAPRTQ